MKKISALFKDIKLALLMMLPVYALAIATIFINLNENQSIIISDCIGNIIGLILCIFYLRKNQLSLTNKSVFLKPDLILLTLILLFQINWTLFSSQFFFAIFPNKEEETEITFIQQVLAVVFAPIAEEIIFRFGMINLGKKYVSLFTASLFSIIIFVLVHFPDLPSFFAIFGIALVYSLVYNATHNLIYTIAAHMLNNLISVLALHYSIFNKITDAKSVSDLNNPVFYISIAGIVLTSFIMVKRVKCFKSE